MTDECLSQICTLRMYILKDESDNKEELNLGVALGGGHAGDEKFKR